ncbi:hypothetical protein IMSAG025_00787 [Muribaculaceae bacterium]|nr:hypothetical protein IMSAGC016_00445 [Muribaculaceae bacterium]GFI57347.1 hypothetical protein IMSAG025_00787 [Muribaculaceae bacterium]
MNTEFNNFALTDFKRRQWYDIIKLEHIHNCGND